MLTSTSEIINDILATIVMNGAVCMIILLVTGRDVLKYDNFFDTTTMNMRNSGRSIPSYVFSVDRSTGLDMIHRTRLTLI